MYFQDGETRDGKRLRQDKRCPSALKETKPVRLACDLLRLSLHPKGLAPMIANLAEWRHHLIERTRRLEDEIAIPLKLRTPGGVLSFFSTITVFGTAVEITLSEISLEAFYPADDATAAALRAL
jgi:hypothetical protein